MFGLAWFAERHWAYLDEIAQGRHVRIGPHAWAIVGGYW